MQQHMLTELTGWSPDDVHQVVRIGIFPDLENVDDWIRRTESFNAASELKGVHPARAFLAVDGNVVIWAQSRIDLERYLITKGSGCLWRAFSFHGERAGGLGFSIRQLRKSKLLVWTFQRRYVSWQLIQATLPASATSRSDRTR